MQATAASLKHLPPPFPRVARVIRLSVAKIATSPASVRGVSPSTSPESTPATTIATGEDILPTAFSPQPLAGRPARPSPGRRRPRSGGSEETHSDEEAGFRRERRRLAAAVAPGPGPGPPLAGGYPTPGPPVGPRAYLAQQQRLILEQQRQQQQQQQQYSRLSSQVAPFEAGAAAAGAGMVQGRAQPVPYLPPTRLTPQELGMRLESGMDVIQNAASLLGHLQELESGADTIASLLVWARRMGFTDVALDSSIRLLVSLDCARRVMYPPAPSPARQEWVQAMPVVGDTPLEGPGGLLRSIAGVFSPPRRPQVLPTTTLSGAPVDQTSFRQREITPSQLLHLMELLQRRRQGSVPQVPASGPTFRPPDIPLVGQRPHHYEQQQQQQQVQQAQQIAISAAAAQEGVTPPPEPPAPASAEGMHPSPSNQDVLQALLDLHTLHRRDLQQQSQHDGGRPQGGQGRGSNRQHQHEEGGPEGTHLQATPTRPSGPPRHSPPAG